MFYWIQTTKPKKKEKNCIWNVYPHRNHALKNDPKHCNFCFFFFSFYLSYSIVVIVVLVRSLLFIVRKFGWIERKPSTLSVNIYLDVKKHLECCGYSKQIHKLLYIITRYPFRSYPPFKESILYKHVLY